ncbi:MAG TPA: site-2 protease family protein, partial [Candidatus Paceibacterota bacterium]|nr:site-2 protease family protein [Candidatus Paceibacterota bacterium]
PVGIAVLTQKISKMGSGFFFAFMASLSINLAFMNLLPIPALDGGKLLFLLFEQIKGSALNKKFENYATIGGFAFLMILVLIVTIKDVISLF